MAEWMNRFIAGLIRVKKIWMNELFSIILISIRLRMLSQTQTKNGLIFQLLDGAMGSRFFSCWLERWEFAVAAAAGLLAGWVLFCSCCMERRGEPLLFLQLVASWRYRGCTCVRILLDIGKRRDSFSEVRCLRDLEVRRVRFLFKFWRKSTNFTFVEVRVPRAEAFEPRVRSRRRSLGWIVEDVSGENKSSLEMCFHGCCEALIVPHVCSHALKCFEIIRDALKCFEIVQVCVEVVFF